MENKEIYLAGGCFWGTEHYFKQIEGVVETQVGYANGHTERPTYQDVCTDLTGFAETVRVVYDPRRVGLRFLLRMYFQAIDPLSLNKQGEDEGTRYRTGVYFVTEAQVPGISAALDRCAAALGQPLAVELLPLQNFYRAEEYHQDYLEKNPTGYCHLSPAIFRIAEEA
jgi:methionine-S-sulfoxide reductase